MSRKEELKGYSDSHFGSMFGPTIYSHPEEWDLLVSEVDAPPIPALNFGSLLSPTGLQQPACDPKEE